LTGDLGGFTPLPANGPGPVVLAREDQDNCTGKGAGEGKEGKKESRKSDKEKGKKERPREEARRQESGNRRNKAQRESQKVKIAVLDLPAAIAHASGLNPRPTF